MVALINKEHRGNFQDTGYGVLSLRFFRDYLLQSSVSFRRRLIPVVQFVAIENGPCQQKMSIVGLFEKHVMIMK